MSQSEREWCIEAELPGVNKEAIDVQVHDHHLILSAEMRDDRQSQEGRIQRQYHGRECRIGYFRRVIPLPQNVQKENITCEFRNGVLTVDIPKADRAERGGRRIPVYSTDELPSETAAGRRRTQQEISMTQVGSRNGDEERAMAGAKGGETSSDSTQAESGAKTRTSRAKKSAKTNTDAG